jgi:methyl acetate hydrolase
MTKAMGATAAAILIDRGELDLDTWVEDVLPEFAELERINSDAGKAADTGKAKVSIRHLATHTSGLAYEFYDPAVAKYLALRGVPPVVSGMRAALKYPLLFEAGTQWQYGPGADWLGQVVERVDGRPIDRFCIEEIFRPLGLTNTVFSPGREMAAKIGSVWQRESPEIFGPAEMNFPPNPEFYGMGHCLYSTAPDYLKFLRLFLNGGTIDGARILSETMVQTMLSNQIGDLRLRRLRTEVPFASYDLDIFPNHAKSHSLAFARMEEPIPGMRAAGTQFWGGVLNTHCWLDPENRLAGVLMTQLLPFLDPDFMAAFHDFERAAYAIR